VRRSGAIDVHLVAHTYMSGGLKLPRFHGILPLKRKLLGVLFSVGRAAIIHDVATALA
jgi:hypothetical protein